MSNSYLSTYEYALKHNISKMQVIRLIHAGKIVAHRVGNSWMISETENNFHQIEFEKTTSIQKWNKAITAKFHKNIKAQKSKDREIIYARLRSLGLPTERSIAFSKGKFPTKREFEIALGRLGLPYWISAVPNPDLAELNRLTKLGIYDIKPGWKFINKIAQKEEYKILVSQYPDDAVFKGSLLISKQGNGVGEFITGDRHYIMSMGFTLTDPMLFNQEKIVKYSKTITPSKQRCIWNLVRGINGYLELQYGNINKKNCLTFFDHDEEESGKEIDDIWRDLISFYNNKKREDREYLYGLPASSGKAVGRCIVVHHENNLGSYESITKGDILVSDMTTPEMTPLMNKVSAIITDLGGVTCHAAIVCRELKIPAIVGTVKATDRLRTGMRVKVNADKGEIEILS